MKTKSIIFNFAGDAVFPPHDYTQATFKRLKEVTANRVDGRRITSKYEAD